MNKKILVSVLLCFFIFSLGLLAKEKATILENLVWVETPRDQYILLSSPVDDTVLQQFKSDTFLAFDVPASPQSDAIFFEFFVQPIVWWTNYIKRFALSYINFRIINPNIIPDYVEVLGIKSVGIGRESNPNGIYETTSTRENTAWKLAMRRNSYGACWYIRNKITKEEVPDNIAQNILNSLIDSGFNVEVYSDGSVQGVSDFILYPVCIQVTRLSKD